MLSITVLLIGASVDIGRWMLARKQTEEAIDAANLAGLRYYQNSTVLGDTTGAATAAMTTYNYSVTQSKRGTPTTNGLIATDNVSFAMDSTMTKMVSSGNVQIKMPFLSLVPIPSLPKVNNSVVFPVLKRDGTENGVATMTVGNNSGQSLEVSIMLDNTGSMAESIGNGISKMQAVKNAANDLVDQVVWADQSTYTSKIGIAPFTEAVRMQSQAMANMVHGTPATGATNSLCVVERTGSQAFTDGSPISDPLGIYPYGNGRACGNLPAMTPLTSDKTALHSLINSMQPNNSTSGHLGTAWAWYILSPNFNSIWSSASNGARPYGDLTVLNTRGQPVLKKIAILMTDGQYNSHYCYIAKYGPNLTQVSDPSSNSSCGNGDSSSQALSLCTNMKAKGIEVFTIGAGMTGQDDAQTLLKNCATDSTHYYDASDTNKLMQAFADITKKLVKPYISH